MGKRRNGHSGRPTSTGRRRDPANGHADRTAAPSRFRRLRGPAVFVLGIGLGALAVHAPRLDRCEARQGPHPPSNGSAERATADADPRRRAPVGPPAIDHTRFAYSDSVVVRLDEVRREKRQAILRLFHDVEKTARGIAEDETLRRCFHEMRGLYDTEAGRAGQCPESVLVAARKYQRAIDQYYLLNYRRFYDILFVSPDGYVFYSIRKEPDYHTWIAEDSFLGQGLRKSRCGPAGEFVLDYHYYPPSGKPSAFFLVPVVEDGVRHGWFVLQYPIKMLDMLMVDHSELGHTGEVYLVNRERRMLTDSRFHGEHTHLRFSVDALESAEREGGVSGSGLTTDYRGVRVFGSYERFRVLGQEWIIVAQIDEAEVITDFYRENQQRCRARLLERLARTPAIPRSPCPPNAEAVLVDMDDFEKAEEGEALATRGVSTCTAVTVTLPGRFSYLAHISPYDKIYGANRLTNTLKQLINRIRYYDIYQNELGKLEVVIVATHTDSIDMVLNKLMRYGITLAQIRFAWEPRARYADVMVPSGGGETIIEWVQDDIMPQRRTQWASDLADLASVVRALCRLPDQAGTET